LSGHPNGAPGLGRRTIVSVDMGFASKESARIIMQIEIGWRKPLPGR